MTKQEIINNLRKYRYSPAHRYGKQGCTLANIAAMANTIPDAVRFLRDYGKSVGPGWLARVERAVTMIENGDVRFVFARERDEKGRLTSGSEYRRIEYVNKPKRRPPPQERITRAADHASWALCRTCQGEKFLPIVMHGSRYYACSNCCGPVHWRILGARAPTKEELDFFPGECLQENILA